MADLDKIIYLRNQYSESTAGNAPPPPLDGGGGGPHDPGMESRVTRLEVEYQHVRRDLDQINAKMDKMDARLNELPTKRDLTTNLQWIIATTFGVCFAVVSIFVGVLAYLQDQKTASSAPSSAAPAPIVIQIPYPAAPVAPPAPAPLQPPVVK
jgi:hypothetical protein